MFRLLSAVIALMAATAPLAVPIESTAAAPGVLDDGYQSPVVAPVADPFRLPNGRYGSGNRGIEYATRVGQPVVASGTGVVVFAGSVAGRLVVSIDHVDGLRTTYTRLSHVAVKRGESVRRGAPLGRAAVRFHFGVRAGHAYLDPAQLFSAGRRPARLVPIRRIRPR